MPDMGNVADTIQAVLECKQLGIGAYVGGSCNETALSAQITVAIALATQADQVLGKPRMGVAESLMIIKNEMSLRLGRIRNKSGRSLRYPSDSPIWAYQPYW